MCSTLQADPARIIVHADQAGIAVPATLHGLFFEDINYAGDGGLYAELIQNRSFEHKDSLYAWSKVAAPTAKGSISVESDGPLNGNNTHFLRINVSEPGEGFGIENSGFDGIALKQGDSYWFSIYARRRAGTSDTLQVDLRDEQGRSICATTITGIGTSWKKFEATLTSTATISNARLAVMVMQPGAVDVDMVSLFPQKTFKGRRNGLRADLAQALADEKPGFLRFPGGCIVEGKDFDNMYRWKDTIGDVAERKENWDIWLDKTSPEYYQTYGLGFFEYFQLCEDIGAEPVPVINCGMCCQARQGPPVPMGQIGPYVQDALDLIEFANGPASSEWGAKRAAMGHPEPFHLKTLAVGNEQWQQGYFDRYDLFYRAIKAKYPEIKIISSAGPLPDDSLWHFAWDKFRSGTPADVVDEHYYVPPRWLLEHGDRYASYDRTGPKIFVGEFAGHESNRHNDLRSALSEAAYMTSLWRNADVVAMASYAPLFAKAGHVQWRPDLIWFDNSRVALTPNYFAQAQFAGNRPDTVFPTEVSAAQDHPRASGMIGVGTWNTHSEYKDIRVTSADGRTLFASDFSNGLAGWKTAGGDWKVVDGALREASDAENVRAVAGDPSWSNYNLTLRARKLGGDEGFLILFETPNIDSPVWWNLGGWKNTEHALQGEGMNEKHMPGKIETGRWYDVRIESRDAGVKAYLDGKLLQENTRKPVSMLYAVAGRDQRTHEIVLQIVNPFGTPQDTQINLAGAHVADHARVTILADNDPDAENTLENPDRIMPRTTDLRGVSADFTYQAPAYSLTTMRIPER